MMLTMRVVSYLWIFMFCSKRHANCATVISSAILNTHFKKQTCLSVFYLSFFKELLFFISDIYDNDSPHNDY